jgi:hypothetical protein
LTIFVQRVRAISGTLFSSKSGGLQTAESLVLVDFRGLASASQTADSTLLFSSFC